MLVIYVDHGHVVQVEAMPGTTIVLPDKPHVEGQPDGVVLKLNQYMVIYLDEARQFEEPNLNNPESAWTEADERKRQLEEEAKAK